MVAPASAGLPYVMVATLELLSLSDDELQLVHEWIPNDALWSCVLCCHRLQAAALASGGFALAAAAVAGDLASVKWAHLRGSPLSRRLPFASNECAGSLIVKWDSYATYPYAGNVCYTAAQQDDHEMLLWALEHDGLGQYGTHVIGAAAANGNLEMVRVAHRHGCPTENVCHIAAQQNDRNMLLWALAHGGVNRFGSYCMERAAENGNLEMLRDLREHGCVSEPRAYEVAAKKGRLAIVQWLYQADSECSEQQKQTRMDRAAYCAAVNGQLEVLDWLTDDERDGASEVTASWGRYILIAAARGGHLHIIEWALNEGWPEGLTEAEWARAATLATSAAVSVQKQRI